MFRKQRQRIASLVNGAQTDPVTNSTASGAGPADQATAGGRQSDPRSSGGNARAASPRQVETVLHEDAVVRGRFDAIGPIVLHGRVEGNVRSGHSVSVSATGFVVGEVEGPAVRIAGKVHGNLRAKQGVDLESGAKVVGDVFTRSLRIQEGAILNGMSYMGESWVEELEERGTKDR